MDSQSTNFYITGNLTAVSSSAPSNFGGISVGGGEEVGALDFADVSGLNLNETVRDDQFPRGDSFCRLCGDISGSNMVNQVGVSRKSRKYEDSRQRAITVLRGLGSTWAVQERSEIHDRNNSEKKVCTKNIGNKVSNKNKGKESRGSD